MTIPSMTIPRKKRKKKKRSLTKKKKEKEKKSEKEKEKKAERSTVKMYYWNVALSEHCEEIPLECGSVHWNTEEVCEVAALHTVPLLGRRGSAVPARARATKSS